MDDSQNIPLIGIEDFLKEVEEIQELNKSYDENLEKIENIQGRLLQIGWNQKVREQVSEELESLMSKNKGFQNDITKKIKLGWSRDFSSPTDLRIRDQQMTTLTEQLKETFTKSKNLEIQFKTKLRQKLVQTIKIAGVQLTEEQIQHKVDTNQIDEFCSVSILRDTEDAKLQLEEITVRHDQIKQLEEDIQELTELFKQMNEYVALQGITVDKIEQNVDGAAVNVRSAVDLLKDAKVYLKTRRKLVAIITASMILLLLIIIIASSVSQENTPVIEKTIIHIEQPSSSNEKTTTPTPTKPIDSCPDTDPWCVG